MDCEEARELLSPYLDRELTPEEMTAIAEHLEDCKDCAEQSTIFGQLSKIVKHWEGIRSPEQTRRELVEKVRRAGTRKEVKKTFPLVLLALLAGALLLGGAAALIVWLLGRGGPSEDGRPAAAECVQTAGRVEVVVEDGARVSVEGRRRLYAGQEFVCSRGSAAQVEIPAARGPWLRLVLRGPGRLQINQRVPSLLKGKLIFHLEATMGDGPGYPLKAGRWTVVLPQDHSPTVGMIELAEGGIRVAMLKGNVRLGAAGPEVKAGTEVTMDSGGTLSPPKKIGNPKDFDLLVK